jgi:hypothetical protein
MNNTNIDQTLSELNRVLKYLVDATHQPVSQQRTQFLEFQAGSGEENFGKGVIWSGNGITKQFVLNRDPDRFFSSENIDLDKNHHFSIGNNLVLSGKELGSSVVKSNLQTVGRLKELDVDGSVSINQYLFYNAITDRLGLGIEEPNSAFSVAEDGVEVMLGTRNHSRGIVGTYASNHFDIVAGNTTWISVSPSGNIMLGNTNHAPIQLSVNGSLAIKVAVPDSNVDLHVNGPIRFHGHLHFYAKEIPVSGSYNSGDIVWNTAPTVGNPVGWVCTNSGNPGRWNPFGQITI